MVTLTPNSSWNALLTCVSNSESKPSSRKVRPGSISFSSIPDRSLSTPLSRPKRAGIRDATGCAGVGMAFMEGVGAVSAVGKAGKEEAIGADVGDAGVGLIQNFLRSNGYVGRCVRK